MLYRAQNSFADAAVPVKITIKKCHQNNIMPGSLSFIFCIVVKLMLNLLTDRVISSQLYACPDKMDARPPMPSTYLGGLRNKLHRLTPIGYSTSLDLASFNNWSKCAFANVRRIKLHLRNDK